MIIDCIHCTAPLLKGVSLESEGEAVFKVSIRCAHCKGFNNLEIRNSVISEVYVEGKRVQLDGERLHEKTNIRSL